MRSFAFIPFLLATSAAMRCGTGVEPPPPSGGIVVHIYWDDRGVSGKKVELVELHRTGTTNDKGLVRFVAAPGEYTLRAYEINRGGPMLGFIETPVTITAGRDERVDIVDCLPCD
jgi:hypothetical protein